jgi:hypothetical protein
VSQLELRHRPHQQQDHHETNDISETYDHRSMLRRARHSFHRPCPGRRRWHGPRRRDGCEYGRHAWRCVRITGIRRQFRLRAGAIRESAEGLRQLVVRSHPIEQARARSTNATAANSKAGKTTKAKRTKLAKNETTRGNSAFGHRQGDAATRTTGSQNNAFGKARSAAAKEKANDPRTETADSAKVNAEQSAPGNSAFGHRQGDAATRTTGSQNNAYGQARAAEARSDKGNGEAQAIPDEGHATSRGNSEFGHRQGDASTRTTGQQNSEFGRTRAEEAKAKADATPTPTPAS